MKHNSAIRLLTNVIGGGISLISLNFFACLLLSCGEDTTIDTASNYLTDTRTQAADSTAVGDSAVASSGTIVVDTAWAAVMEYNFDGTPAADTLNINVPGDGDISEGDPEDAA